LWTKAVTMYHGFQLVCLALLLGARSALGLPRGVERAVVVTKPSEIEKSYDYIIIGGGTSGLTVADRLTEDGQTKVLVVEYGELSRLTYLESKKYAEPYIAQATPHGSAPSKAASKVMIRRSCSALCRRRK
jgi:hypothetical protein